MKDLDNALFVVVLSAIITVIKNMSHLLVIKAIPGLVIRMAYLYLCFFKNSKKFL